MARYRINELSFIDNQLVQPGSEIDTDATPAAHWEPLDKKAEKATAQAEADEAERIRLRDEKQAGLDAAQRAIDAGNLL